MNAAAPATPVISLSPIKYLIGCAVVAVVIAAIGLSAPFPSWVLAVEVIVTVIALFVFGSIRYRLDKNALTYGAALVMIATFFGGWWNSGGSDALSFAFLQKHFLSLEGWDKLVHADTMLFILGLTFFVAVIAQTKLLETISFWLLRRFKGNLLLTVAVLGALVSFLSGILDGVSMIGLMIRTLIIIFMLSKLTDGVVVYAVVVSTVVTTVCGMWLAYGEPPNLIMKSNLAPHLDDRFFLRYCLPVAIGAYGIVLWNMRRHLYGVRLDLADLVTAETSTRAAFDSDRDRRIAQWSGCVAFVPFIGLLIWHAVDHDVPLFWSSFAGFGVALLGIVRLRTMRAHALREARHEYAEYLFLFPLFLSITLLQKTGFFSQLSELLVLSVQNSGASNTAYAQFIGTTFLSAILDNNVVADFAGRAIAGFELDTLKLFALAQIAGYAIGGCLTHVGSAQSVVAFAFIRKAIDRHFTPLQWIKVMTPIVLQISIWASVVIYAEGWLSK